VQCAYCTVPRTSIDIFFIINELFIIPVLPSTVYENCTRAGVRE
jgi:hypothetical protein